MTMCSAYDASSCCYAIPYQDIPVWIPRYQHSQSPHAGTCNLTHLINKGSDEGHMCIAFPKGEGCTCRYFLGGWGFPNIALRIQCKITNLYQIPEVLHYLQAQSCKSIHADFSPMGQCFLTSSILRQCIEWLS